METPIDTATQNQNVTVTPRPLTMDEATCLHQELKSTPNILGYTVKELHRFHDVLVAEVEGNFAGACISKDLAFGWTDIAALYVLPAYRGRSIGTLLYTAAWERAQDRQRHIYTLSRSPAVIHLMERFGMKMTRAVWLSPLAVHLHNDCHMMSLYRWREMFRKASMRTGGPSFVAGMKRR